MDGARYHKRRTETIPSSNSKKADIIAWLHSHNIEHTLRMTKFELSLLIKSNKEKVPFACVEIAKKHGHQILYTPPYHCELQPIEGIWAVAKNEVGRYPRRDLLETRNKLFEAFLKINSTTVVGLWKRSLKVAKKYWENLEEDRVVVLEEEFSEDDIESSDSD
jgi:transposase